MQRKGSAVWNGDLKSGKGTVSSGSGALNNAQYSFSTRFENGVGTNPEELIAAAHAGCFSMALSGQLGEAKLTPKSVRTTATVTRRPAGPPTGVHLDVVAAVRAPRSRRSIRPPPTPRPAARSRACSRPRSR
jgi:osmotically inducible protein OsmC